MAKRSIVFPESKKLIGYATKAGLTLERFWKSIEAELARRPRASEITIRGPKQTVTIKLTRDSRVLEKQVFADVKLGSFTTQDSDTNGEVERSEDAGKAIEPGISEITDKNNISDMTPAAKKGHNRTPWPLEEEERIKPRYPIPALKPNRFHSEEIREKRKLFHEKWAELNRTHNWPAWLVADRDNRLTAEILEWMYPNILTSEKEMRRASIILEAVNVFLLGREPSKDSPLYQEDEKTTAKRVRRFLKDAGKWWELQAFIQESEADYNRAEAANYLRESYDQARAEGDLKRIHELEDNFGYVPEDESDDYVVRLWRKRLDDEE